MLDELPENLNKIESKPMGALVYCRVSTVDQANNFSLESQKQIIFEFCAKAGMEIVQTFMGAGESAKTTKRPEFQKLLKFAVENQDRVRAVVVYDWSRFSRNLRDRMNVQYHLKQHGIIVLSVTQSDLRKDDEDPDTWLGQTINSVIDEHMIRKLRVNVKRGMIQAFNKGYWPFQAPLGYIQERDESGRSLCLLNAESATWVRTAFKMADEGHSSRKILALLKTQGINGKRGRPLNLGTIKSTLTNSFYCGLMRARNFGEKMGRHQAIITPEMFHRVQAKYKGAQVHFGFLKFREDFPLRHTVKCGDCDRRMVAYWTKGRKQKYPYYSCRGCGENFRAENLEKEFIFWLDEKIPLTNGREANNIRTGVRWSGSSYADKRKFLALWFPNGVRYSVKQGFWVENNLLPGLEVAKTKKAGMLLN